MQQKDLPAKRKEKCITYTEALKALKRLSPLSGKRIGPQYGWGHWVLHGADRGSDWRDGDGRAAAGGRGHLADAGGSGAAAQDVRARGLADIRRQNVRLHLWAHQGWHDTVKKRVMNNSLPKKKEDHLEICLDALKHQQIMKGGNVFFPQNQMLH